MKTTPKPKGPWIHRFSIRLFTVVLAVLVYWVTRDQPTYRRSQALGLLHSRCSVSEGPMVDQAVS